MYLEYFELDETPFRLTPDPSFLYLSKGHTRAKAYMDYTVWNRDGFAVITGGVGSGKTTLIEALISQLGDNVLVAKLHQTQLNEVEFLQAVLSEFGVETYSSNKVELLNALNDRLLENYEKGKQTLLIIDEAQNLSPRVLEEIRLLTGLETKKEKVLNLILAGQPELKEILDSPSMDQLAQRIRFRFHLEPLTEAETRTYIKHRLTTAGRKKRSPFSNESIELIYRYSGGVPRLVNALCDTALISAFVNETKVITPALVEEAISELGWVPYSERAHNSSRSAQDKKSSDVENKNTPHLIYVRPDNKLKTYSLAEGKTTLGRMPSNDIMLDDISVSGHHAKIMLVHGNVYVEDINSTNGTFVNGSRIKGKYQLNDGDVIKAGRCKLQFSEKGENFSPKDDTQVTQMLNDTVSMENGNITTLHKK